MNKIANKGQNNLPDPWNGFNRGIWQKEINIRDFIQQNYKPYAGDGSFLSPAAERTKRIWDKRRILYGT